MFCRIIIHICYLDSCRILAHSQLYFVLPSSSSLLFDTRVILIYLSLGIKLQYIDCAVHHFYSYIAFKITLLSNIQRTWNDVLALPRRYEYVHSVQYRALKKHYTHNKGSTLYFSYLYIYSSFLLSVNTTALAFEPFKTLETNRE